MTPDYSPRGIGRIIDGAFDVYRANFKTVALGSLIVIFPLALLVGLAQVFYTRGLLATIPVIATGDLAFDRLNRLQVWALLSNAASMPFAAARLYIASALFASAPAMLAGERPGVREFLKSGWRRFGWLLLASVLLEFVFGAGFIFLIVPGVYLWARLTLVPAVTVIEDAPLDRAFSRSWQLTRGAVWRAIGLSLALWIFTVVLETAIDAPALVRQLLATVNSSEAVFQELSTGWKTLEGVLTAVSAALVYPLATFTWLGFYLDLRARREAIDITVKAMALNEERAR